MVVVKGDEKNKLLFLGDWHCRINFFQIFLKTATKVRKNDFFTNTCLRAIFRDSFNQKREYQNPE